MSSLAKTVFNGIRNNLKKCAPAVSTTKTMKNRPISHLAYHEESPDEFNCRYEFTFSRPDIDGWDVRQAMTDILGYDCVPEPNIIIAALYACRRVNDYALAVRWLEAVKNKCGKKTKEFYPYILQEISPTLCELGADAPESLGYDKPELHLEPVDAGMGYPFMYCWQK